MRRLDSGTAGPAQRKRSPAPSLAARAAAASRATPRSTSPSPSPVTAPGATRPAAEPWRKRPRQQRLDYLIDSSIYGWHSTKRIVSEFERMNLTKAEKQYVSKASSRRGEKAIARAAHKDVADVAHGAVGAARFVKHGLETGIGEYEKGPVHSVENVTGINVRHPLNHGPYWLGANLALLAAPGVGRAAGAGAKVGARAVESAAARKAIARLAQERGSARLPGGPPGRPDPLSAAEGVPARRPGLRAVEPPAPTAAEKLTGALPEAEKIRAQQAKGYSSERGQRFAAYEQAWGDAVARGVDPREAERIASQHLAGELAKVRYQGMRHFTDDDISQMAETIRTSPLKMGEKKRAVDAINKAVEGAVPQPHQIVLLKKVFGADTAADLKAFAQTQDERSTLSKVVTEATAAPRTLQSTLDVSYLLRQALVAGTRHPQLWGKTIMPSLRAMSKEGYELGQEGLGLRDFFDEAQEHGLAVTEIGHGTKAEEAYATQYLTKLPGISHSSHAYTYFLNKLRLDMYAHLRPQALEAARTGKGATILRRGKPRDEEEALRSLTRYINSATGRGVGGPTATGRAFEATAPVAAKLLFSPRLLKARFDFLNPVWYARMDPFARKEALKAASSTIGAGMAFLGLASQVPGVSVGMNPMSANFGRIRIGDTRVDLWGGFQPLVRLYAQLATGTYIASTSGKEFSLKKGGFGESTRYDIAQNFLRSKYAPLPGTVVDYFDKQDVTGQPFRWQDMWQRVVPMMVGDILDTYHETAKHRSSEAAAAAGVGAAALSALGVGVQSYGPRNKRGGRPVGGIVPSPLQPGGRIVDAPIVNP